MMGADPRTVYDSNRNVVHHQYENERHPIKFFPIIFDKVILVSFIGFPVFLAALRPNLSFKNVYHSRNYVAIKAYAFNCKPKIVSVQMSNFVIMHLMELDHKYGPLIPKNGDGLQNSGKTKIIISFEYNHSNL